MLTITRKRIPGGGFEIKMEGHADAERNEQDHDLVCAAASMLCYTLAACVGLYCSNPVVAIAPGKTLIRAVPRVVCAADFRAAYEAIAAGFDLLAGQYPDNVEVIGWN